jgi:intracellular septation protein
MHAIFVLVTLSILSIVTIYIAFKSVPAPHLISTLIVVIFGAISLVSQNSVFIKIKVTVLNSIFAMVLLTSVLMKKNLFRYILGNSISLEEKTYRTLSLRFAFLFALLAILNEIVWRNFSESFWVNFKVFGILSITSIFMLAQLPFIKRHLQQN